MIVLVFDGYEVFVFVLVYGMWFKVVFFDLMMFGFDGLVIFWEFCVFSKSVLVFIMSGYSEIDVCKYIIVVFLIGFILKFFIVDDFF